MQLHACMCVYECVCVCMCGWFKNEFEHRINVGTQNNQSGNEMRGSLQ